MQKNTDSKKRTSGYNQNREHHASDDCTSYTYARWNAEQNRYDKITLTAGEDGVIEEIILLLDQMDYDADLNDRYQAELRDAGFEAKVKKYHDDPNADEAVDPWDEVADSTANPDADSDETQENPDAAKVRKVVDESFTPEQQDLYFAHFGEGKQLEEIRQVEAERTGKPVTPQAMNNRKNKMIRKAAKKAFGVEPVKRRKTDKKD